MNPDFEGINSDVITYAETVGDTALRVKINKYWFEKKDIGIGLMSYAYNTLMSIEPNGLLIVQNDGETYALWMLQDVKGIRTDVSVVNVDFLIEDSYRNRIFSKFSLSPLSLKSESINGWSDNWTSITQHLLNNYHGKGPLHLSLTMFPYLYKGFENKLKVCGLTLLLPQRAFNAIHRNKEFTENLFLFDYLKTHLVSEGSVQYAVYEQELNYLKCFKIVYDDYKRAHNVKGLQKVKRIALTIAGDMHDEKMIANTVKMFN